MRPGPLVTSLLFGALVLAGCGEGPTAPAGDGGSAVTARASGVATYPPGEQHPALHVRGELLDGGRFDSDRYAGRVLVYNVWGSWCAPCRAEAPALRQVAAETRSQGVQFVGINTRDNREAARAFERSFGITYPSVFDADGQVLLAFRGIVPVAAVPTTVVVDRDGKVTARIIGRATLGDLRAGTGPAPESPGTGGGSGG